MAPNKTRTNRTNEIFLAIFSNDDNILLSNNPKITGTVTIKNIWNAILEIDWPSFNVPKSNICNDISKIIGTVIAQRILFTAVNEIDKATLPLAYELKTLLVTPPGAAANIMTPIANSGVNGQNKTMIRAIIGSAMIWRNKPKKKSFGLKNTLVKSVIERPSPKENIIKAKEIGNIISVIIPIIYFIIFKLQKKYYNFYLII